MVKGELAAAARENFRTHAAYPSRDTPGAMVRESEELTWVDAGLDTDTFNIVMGARLARTEVQRAIAEVRAHFESVRRPFSWWVSPGDEPSDLGERLAAAGLMLEEWELAMACEIPGALGAIRPVPGLEVERARHTEDLEEFARINAENWTPADPVVELYYSRSVARLLGPASPLRFYVGRLGEQAVAAVEIAVAGGVLGVYNLSTRAEHRGRGIGGTLLSTALRDSQRDTGAREAVLQAAPAAAGLYRRLGFAEFGRITEFKPVRNVR
jgi:ribosomal protein S18 acetylase RimI-like enzyme